MRCSVVSKVNSCLKYLYRQKLFLNLKERKLLCMALLQSRFDYGYNVYYRNLCQGTKHKLQTAQNKMVRYILGANSRYHITCNDFMSLKLLNVDSRFHYLTLCLMYNIFNGTAPDYMCQDFCRVSHGYSTRNKNMAFVLPHVHAHGSRSFTFNAIKL